jgi:hypothetical protein
MCRRAGLISIGLVFVGCTDRIVLDDQWDSGSASQADGRDSSAVLPPPDVQPGSDACPVATKTLTPTREAAEVIILLDRSTQMQASWGDTTRAAAAQDALVQAISSYQAFVKFGFEQFPADPSDSKTSDLCPRNGCCGSSVLVNPATNDGNAMKYYINCGVGPKSSPCPAASDDSPSYAALAQVRDHFKNQPPSNNSRFVVLVTSSNPSCAADNSDLCDEAASAAYDLANGANGNGIDGGAQIIVFSIGGPSDLGSCLARIAYTGSSSPRFHGGRSLYSPSTPDQVTSDIRDFVALVARNACNLDLYPNAPDSTTVVVSLASAGGSTTPTPVPQTTVANPNGWSFSNPPLNSRIALSGSACDQFLDPQVNLQVDYTYSTCCDPNACFP